MQLFIVFILGAVLLGAGSMLSPAWNTLQPRIALSATLCLALIVGGAVFYAEAFGWDTLIVDYLLFAIMAGVVLGGTLSHAQTRAEAKGEVLLDQDQGWPGPYDLAFFVVAAFFILVPLINLVLPLGTEAQELGYMSLIARFGESFHNLAPYYPDVSVTYAPGFHAFSAYLSQQLGQAIPMIQMAVAAIVLYLCVWLAYDLGAEIQDKRLGRALSIAFFLCFGVFISYLDGHFAELMGLLFTMAFLLYAIRFIRQPRLADMVAGGLMMGAVIFTSLSMSLILLMGFIPLCIATWLNKRDDLDNQMQFRARIGISFGFPLVMLIGISPWLLRNVASIFPIIASPYQADFSLIQAMIMQNIVIIPLAIVGMIIGIRRRESDSRFISVIMLAWLIIGLDFSLTGIIGKLIPPLGDLSNAPIIARHSLILPFIWFGGICLLWIWDTRLSAILQSRFKQIAYPLIALAGIIGILIAVFFQPLLDIAGSIFDLPPMASSIADIAAMTWLRENSDPTARILSYRDQSEWIPVIAERDSVPFSAVYYFEWGMVEPSKADADLMEMLSKTDKMLDSDVLKASGIDYIFVPSVRDQDLDNPLLTQVFEQDGARVYKLDA